MKIWKSMVIMTLICAGLIQSESYSNVEAAQEKISAAENFPAAKSRIVTSRISKGKPTDIVNGVTRIDTSKIWTPVEKIDFSAKHEVLIKNPDGSLTPMDEPYFAAVEIAPDTWQIRSDGDYCYLLAGDSIAVMIDCGYGAGNIRKYAETLTDKPVKYVINTHYHFDHSANDAYFEAAFMTKASVDYATIPYASFEGLNFPRNYPVITVTDGYKINLGNRELEIIEFPHPNHTLGGIAILDRSRKILFSGDEFLFPNRVELNISLKNFAENMRRVKEIRSDFNKLYGGPGYFEVNMIDRYYDAAMYAMTPNFVPTAKVESRSDDQSGKKNFKDEVPNVGRVVYIRGGVRPGDHTENAPEKIPEGIRVSYEYNGFTVSFIYPYQK